MNVGIFKGKITKVVEEFTTYEKEFVQVEMQVKRLSNTYDNIQIIMPKNIYSGLNTEKFIEVRGGLRSKNILVNEKSRLIIYVNAKYVCELEEEEWANNIDISGYLAKPTNYRETPFGRIICDFILANNNSHRSYYIPCIAWENNAKFMKQYGPNNNEEFICKGRLQSREYVKRLEDGTQETKTAYELSVNEIEVASSLTGQPIIEL